MNKIKCKILHMNNCSNQSECYQKFIRLLSSSASVATQIHKFTQKFGFKESYDGASKLIKNSFNKFECELTRMANVFDYYYHIKTELFKNDLNLVKQEYYFNICSNLIAKKRQPGHQICADTLTDYEALTQNTEHEHIFYINRSGTLDIKLAKDICELFQIFSESNPYLESTSFIISSLLCSCVTYRRNLAIISNCEFAVIQNIQREDIR